MKKKISVDVILCCYNQEQYIAKAVESILMQNVEGLDVRVLVADDCSQDGTLDIIRSYESKSPFPFEYLSDDHNLGLVKNYKRAFAACKADYVAILEGDDWWSSPEHLQNQVNALEKYPRSSMCFNNFSFYSERDGLRVANWAYGKREFIKLSVKECIIYGNQIGNLSACVFRNKFLKRLPDRFFEMTVADWELSILMATYGPVLKLKHPTSVYRKNEQGQWSKQTIKERRENDVMNMEKFMEILPERYSKYAEIVINKLKENKPLGLLVRKSLKSKLKHCLKALKRAE